MARSKGTFALALGIVLALALPLSAQAATKTVYAGPPKATGPFGAKGTGDLDTFSLPTVTVHVGDKVHWVINGAHTVTFPKQGGGDIPFTEPDPSGVKYSGFNDAAGNPFWFNHLVTQIILNPGGAMPQGGKTENGSQLTGSGFGPKGYTLTFTKPGTFLYECVVHPGMEAKVKVVKKGKAIPSAKADATAASKQLAAEIKTELTLVKYKPPAGTVSGGHDKGGVVQIRFFPTAIHIPVGGTVKFTVTSKAEIHTFTFGPAAYLQKLAQSLVTPIPAAGGPPTLQFNGQLALPSDPVLPPYDGTGHGNGFLNTGVLAGDPSSHLPSSAQIKFTKAGTYDFICLVHPGMHGKVIVGG